MENNFDRKLYSKNEFWDERYKDIKSDWDWYIDFNELKEYFEYFKINKNSNILIVGSGNSILSKQLVDDGYHWVNNLDISLNILKKMKAKDKSNIQEFLLIDGKNINYRDNIFDVIIDKGTLDALLTNDNLKQNGISLLKEMNRVKSKDGHIFIISHSGPFDRIDYFNNAYNKDIIDNIIVKKQFLNNFSDLINAMRSINKNLTLKQIFMNGELMKKVQELIKKSKLQKVLYNFAKKFKFKNIIDYLNSEENPLVKDIRQNYCYVFIIK